MKSAGPRDRSRSIRRWVALVLAGLLLIGGGAFAVLRVKLHGPELAGNVATIPTAHARADRDRLGRVADLRPQESPDRRLGDLTLRDVRVWDDCVPSADVADRDVDDLRTGDPNEDCTPDDRPDPDPTSRRKPRKLLLHTDLITADVDVHSVLFGKHDVALRNVWVHGGEALLEQTSEPYPLHAYDRTVVSIMTAFYPRMQAGFRAGIYADSAPPIFDLRDFHVQNLNLTIHFNPYAPDTKGHIAYGTSARLVGVDVDAGPQPRNDAYLHMDATDPLVAKFYVRFGVTARHGYVVVNDEGPRDAFRIPGSSPRAPGPGPTPASERRPAARGLPRRRPLLPLPDRADRRPAEPARAAPHRVVPQGLRGQHARARPRGAHPAVRRAAACGRGRRRSRPALAASTSPPDPAAGAQLHLTGELHNYWDRPYDGSWNLALDAKNLGPTIRTCISAPRSAARTSMAASR